MFPTLHPCGGTLASLHIKSQTAYNPCEWCYPFLYLFAVVVVLR